MIDKLQGRDKVVWLSVANKVNEIIDVLNEMMKVPEPVPEEELSV